MQPVVPEVQRVLERIESMMAEVARVRETLDWIGMLHLLEDVTNNPRDIALTVRLAGEVGNIERIFQLHHLVMNTMAESNGILHNLLQDAMQWDNAERPQTIRNLLAGIRGVAEGIDSMTAEVARRQEVLHWSHILLVLGNLKQNPRDIELVLPLVGIAPDLRGIFQLHQNVLTRAAESHALLWGLISDEENPYGTRWSTFLQVPPAYTSSKPISAPPARSTVLRVFRAIFYFVIAVPVTIVAFFGTFNVVTGATQVLPGLFLSLGLLVGSIVLFYRLRHRVQRLRWIPLIGWIVGATIGWALLNLLLYSLLPKGAVWDLFFGILLLLYGLTLAGCMLW